MIRKSVLSFVLGIIASLMSVVLGFYIGLVATAFSGLGGTQFIILAILGWTCVFGGIFGVIASFFCFRHAKTGAILLTITTATTGVSLVWIFIKLMISSNGDSSQLMSSALLGLLTILPAVMYIIATIRAYMAKPTSKKPSQQPNTPVEENLHNHTVE